MKILFLTNNLEVTRPLLAWLCQKEGTPDVRLCCEKISKKVFLNGGCFDNIEFIVSYNYAHIVKEDVISLFPHKIINLHTSLLPWNKGASPNIWSFIEDTPSGVTIHEMDEGIDSGDILLQHELIFDYEMETLASSYHQSHKEMQKMFKAYWEKLKNNRIAPKKQVQGGTVHYKNDLLPYKDIISYDDKISVFLQKAKRIKGEI